MPETGRTHQLRVALKSLGSPIRGDSLYGGDSADRCYLHAAAIELNAAELGLVGPEEKGPFLFSCSPTSGADWSAECTTFPGIWRDLIEQITRESESRMAQFEEEQPGKS